MKILMVDDHDLVRQGLRLLLEGELDWTVVCECSQGVDCLPQLERHQPDLLLLDLNLPDYPGVDLAREVRRRYPTLPILVLTTYDDVASVLGAMRSGASGYIVKSARRDELVAAVRTVAQGGCYLHPRIAYAVLDQIHTPKESLEASWPTLNERDTALLQYVAEGLANPEIALRLHVSLGTVKNNLSQLFQKLGVRDRTQLAAEAARRGWS